MNMTKTIAAMASALVLLTACETIRGFGQDTKKLGNDVTGAAQKHDLDNDPNN